MNTQKILSMSIAILMTVFVTPVFADDDEHERGEGLFSRFTVSRTDVAPVNLPLYEKECGSCHFAYQPGWLPARSWSKIMTSLDKHFGDNAELDADSQSRILDYLQAGAADRAGGRRAKRLLRGIAENDTPLRISELRYIRRQHHEIPSRVFQRSEKLKSLAACAECHQQAASGNFDEDQVKIPGSHAHFD